MRLAERAACTPRAAARVGIDGRCSAVGADRRRRAQSRAHGRQTSDIAARPAPPRALTTSTAGDEARRAAVRPDRIRTVLRAPRARGAAAVKILYSAIDQVVPGHEGGSVHVAAVAEGLAALGHDVTALVTPGPATASPRRVRWIPMPPPLGSTHLRLARARAVARLARDDPPDAIIERYHNFGGEAIRAGAPVGAVAVLEVNAPVIDYPGSRKALARSRAARASRCAGGANGCVALADIIVTPNAAILPPDTPPSTDRSCSSGAPTPTRFRPARGTEAVRGTARRRRSRCSPARSARGTAPIHLVEAIRSLARRGRGDIGAVLIGDGPELAARPRAQRHGFADILSSPARCRTTRCPRRSPRADIGVAPFDVAAHAPLSLGFYWSPLKIFEYMAAGLPVVAPAVDRIPSLVGEEREGLLYDPAAPDALADALRTALRTIRRCARALGAAARERAVREYSWAAHCRALECAIRRRRRRRLSSSPRMRILIADRRLSARVRRQRLEHLRARPRAARARARRRRSSSRARARRRRPRSRLRRLPRPRVRRAGARHPVRAQLLQERAAHAVARRVSRTLLARERFDVVHAQHVMTTIGRRSTRRTRRASRSWPRCAITGPSATGRICCTRATGPTLCPECTVGNMRMCIRPARRRDLAAGAADDSLHARESRGASATGSRARTRSSRSAGGSRRICGRARRSCARRASRSFRIRLTSAALGRRGGGAIGCGTVASPYALYLGKLAPNKGTSYLVDVVRARRTRLAAGRRGRRPDRAATRTRRRRRRAATSSSAAGSDSAKPRGCSQARRC